ncbi:MAG: transporter ATP-binding protein LivG [Pseudomonadota bacterium]|jgi:branched-chain amino acid transport system ATP-binding protein
MSLSLEIEGVHRAFGRTAVLRGVTLEIRAGERVALIGPNGAGKSTLFDLISGRQAPQAGRIRLGGQRIDGLPPHQVHRRGLARSFQSSQLFARLSVTEHLRCAMQHLPRPAQDARIEELLARLQLTHCRGQPARALTHAEQRALEIGLTVAGDAQVLLLDEPTAGMSRSETARFVPLIRDLSRHRTLLVVEHDLSVVFGLAERIAVLVQGEVIAFDTPERVRADPRVQAAYLGALQPDAMSDEDRGDAGHR